MAQPPIQAGVFPWVAPLHVGRTLVGFLIPSLAYTIGVAALIPLLTLPASAPGHEATAVLGVTLGMLIVFRNNAANDRWWEARKLWGQLINESRNLALKARAHVAVELEEHRLLGRFVIGFANALRLHLRGITGIRAVPGFEKELVDFLHGPGYLAERVHWLLDRWNRQGKLKHTVWLLDVHARAFMDVCGACERIRNTPLASSYRALLRWGIGLYVLLSPWSLVPDLGWWSIPVLAIGFAFLMGMELTAEAIEEPFGNDQDDLPLESYCQTIDTFVSAVLELPPPDMME